MESEPNRLTNDITIEFAGMPKSGKSTILDIVSHLLRRSKFPTTEFHGGGRYAPIGKQDLSALNIYLATDAVRHLLLVGNDGTPPSIHLMDRGINDRRIFTHALHRLGKVDDSHRAAIESLLALPTIASKVDLCFVFTVPSELSLARENKNKLITTDGRVMNTELLDSLGTAALDFLSSDSSAVTAVHVDTGLKDGDIVATAQSVADRILDCIAEMGRSGGTE